MEGSVGGTLGNVGRGSLDAVEAEAVVLNTGVEDQGVALCVRGDFGDELPIGVGDRVASFHEVGGAWRAGEVDADGLVDLLDVANDEWGAECGGGAFVGMGIGGGCCA